MARWLTPAPPQCGQALWDQFYRMNFESPLTLMKIYLSCLFIVVKHNAALIMQIDTLKQVLIRILWRFFGNWHVYRHLWSMGNKKTIHTGRSPFLWTFIFENSVLSIKWKCLVGTFFSFSKRLFWKERGLERVTQNARGLTDWRRRERERERARRETPRAVLAVSEFGFEQWSVKVHFLIWNMSEKCNERGR